MNILYISRHQIRLFLKTPVIPLLFIAAPVFIIYIIGQALTGVFAASGAEINAMNYFGVTLLNLAVFQGTSLAAWGVFKEKKSNTSIRLSLAPLAKSTVVWGTFLGIWAVLGTLSFIVLFLLQTLLSVTYAASSGQILVLLGVESLLAAALGVSLSVLLEQEKTANAVISTMVPILVFIGGGYFPVPDSGFLHNLSVISPLRWINLAMLEQMDNSYFLTALLFSLAAASVLLGLAALKVRRHA